MRKRLALLLLMKLSGLWLHKAVAQSSISFEHYYTMGSGTPLNVMPIAAYQGANGFYAEGRYNYEEMNTFSFYMGRTYSKEGNISYSLSPIAGAVMGQFNGGSVGANVSLSYKNFYLYSQPQYSFSVQNSINNFIYSWTDLTYSPSDWLSVGVSLQHTKPYQSKGFMETGLVLETAYKGFTFPVYLFNPQRSDRSITFGANFELNFKKKKKTTEPKPSDPFKEVFPLNKVVQTPPKKELATPVSEQPKPVESIVKVRRVNVLVKTKSEESFQAPQTVAATLPTKLSKESEIKSKEDQNKISTEPVQRLKGEAKSIASSKATIKETVIEKPAYTTLYAIILGPFENEEQALFARTNLMNAYDRPVVLFNDAGNYKLRIPGFTGQREAEDFNRQTVRSEFKISSLVISYKLKNVEPIPLKNSPKVFEATKL